MIPLPAVTTAPAAVVITTRNRVEDLRRALDSVFQQTVPTEVLVIDDGSADGTSEMVRAEFPRARVHREEASLGYIVQRNRGADLVTAPIVFSIDDDAAFSTPRVVEQTLAEFDHPRIGAVAIPFVDVHRGPEIRQQAPDVADRYAIYSYIGTAHAVRRDLFLRLGGYREILVHQGEEEDYCTRMLQAGYVTVAGLADPVLHYESPRRSFERMDFYGARNKVLYAWQNVGFPFVLPHLAVTSAKTLLHDLRPARLRTRIRGLVDGYRVCLTHGCSRLPTSASTYLLGRELKRRGAVALAELEHRLAPIAAVEGAPEPLCVLT
jgi:glycosyltransferase involved in cell wall biosynthesis